VVVVDMVEVEPVAGIQEEDHMDLVDIVVQKLLKSYYYLPLSVFAPKTT
jgi:hypothetical protein